MCHLMSPESALTLQIPRSAPPPRICCPPSLSSYPSRAVFISFSPPPLPASFVFFREAPHSILVYRKFLPLPRTLGLLFFFLFGCLPLVGSTEVPRLKYRSHCSLTAFPEACHATSCLRFFPALPFSLTWQLLFSLVSVRAIVGV